MLRLKYMAFAHMIEKGNEMDRKLIVVNMPRNDWCTCLTCCLRFKELGLVYSLFQIKGEEMFELFDTVVTKLSIHTSTYQNTNMLMIQFYYKELIMLLIILLVMAKLQEETGESLIDILKIFRRNLNQIIESY